MLEQKAEKIATAVGGLSILAIIEFIIMMIEMCAPTPVSLVDAKSLSPLRNAALGVWIRIHFGVRGMSRVNEIRDVIRGEMAVITDEDLVLIWREAKNVLTPVDFPV